MRKLPIIIILALCFFSSCSKEEKKPEELALQTAKVYYEQLLEGDIPAFIDGMYAKDTVVPTYREQLITNMKMFLGQQEKEHNGISAVVPIRAVADTASHTANAFLLLCFGDSTREQVVVPMIEKDGVWMMR